MVTKQEPVRVIILHHPGVVLPVLVALLNHLAVIMEHAQVKKIYLNTCLLIFKIKIALEVKTLEIEIIKICNYYYVLQMEMEEKIQ